MTLYDRLGGAPAVDAAVRSFYERMLADARVAPFFEGIGMDAQIEKQRAFLTMVTGGPSEYDGLDMRVSHASLVSRGLADEHVDVVLEHLGAALADLGAGEAEIADAAALANSVRDDVLNR